MKRFVTAALVTAAVAATGCIGRGDRNSNIPSDRAGGPPSSVANSQVAIVGCLQAGDRAGTYKLVATADTVDRAGRGASTSGTSGQSPVHSVTGVGGDAIADSPTIGAGQIRRTYEVLSSGDVGANLDRQVGSQVSILGLIEDNATATAGGQPAPTAQTIRASSVTHVADRCP
jgi:hypothetical protein